MNIYIEITPIDTIALEVQPSDTIGEVKEKISVQEELSSNQMCLYLAGTLLADGRTLSSYNVGANSRLRYDFDQSVKMLK